VGKTLQLIHEAGARTDMALKICGHLFTGPITFAKAAIRANHGPMLWSVIAREGESFDPHFRLLAIDSAIRAAIDFEGHPDRSQWEAGGSNLAVYKYENSDASPERLQDILAEIRTRHPIGSIVK